MTVNWSLHETALFLIALTNVTAFVGMAFPYGFPLFSFLVLLCLALTFFALLVQPGKSFFGKRSTPFLSFYLLIVASFFYALVVSEGALGARESNNLINLVSLTLLFAISLFWVSSEEALSSFYSRFQYLMIVFAGLVGIAGLHKLYMFSKGVLIERYFAGSVYPIGTSLVNDYNFYALSLICALVYCIKVIIEEKRFLPLLLCSVVSPILLINIALSGSRRAIVVLALILLFVMWRFFYSSAKAASEFFGARVSRKLLYLLLVGVILSPGVIAVAPKVLEADSGTFEKIEYRINTLWKLMDRQSGSSSPTEARTKRWAMAIEIFDDFSLFEKAFGDGFSYYKSLRENNLQPDTQGYPHNLFFSLLLSNGLAGALITISSFLYFAYLAWTIRKSQPELLSLFLIFFFYISTSGDQWFSVKPHLILIFTIFYFYRLKAVNEKPAHLVNQF
ncbi:O-antigen ligase family protein [Emcibacter nanhaiensis]|nr:O-antigen ligase family protein [Emcibacter nanhaiensis]